MTRPFVLEDGCKFALLAATGVRVDIPQDAIVLCDGTRILARFPIELGTHWQSWLGLKWQRLKESNLALLQVATAGFPVEQLSVFDDISAELERKVVSIFTMLRLLGTIEYETASVVTGYVHAGEDTCQTHYERERYYPTRGYLPWVIRERELRRAAELSAAEAALVMQFADMQKVRFWRGWLALQNGLRQCYATDRLHSFVRALEALILPRIGETEKQFVHRCSLFAAPGSEKDAACLALKEVYRMRCDVEHMHGWDRSLASYPVAEQENVALWRTRQMEILACRVYERIFSDRTLQQNFYSDTALEGFWRREERDIRSAFGECCDITRLNPVEKYNAVGRADAAEWPDGLLTDLCRGTP
jgi:hypothetical protein